MTLTTRQIRFIVAFAAVNVLLVAGGWFALVSPQRHGAASAAAQEQAVQAELAALTTGSSQGPSTQPAIHTSDLYALDTALPSPDDISPIEQAALFTESRYLVQPRSVVVLALGLASADQRDRRPDAADWRQ